MSTTDDASIDDADGSAEHFAILARALQAEDTVAHTLQTICRLAVHAVTGAEHAGITLILGKDRFETPAASDDRPRTIDRIQFQTRQGPCLTAVQTRAVTGSADLLTETRWPEFATRTTTETDTRSMLCFPLFLQDNTMGALNLGAVKPDAFTDHSHTLGAVFAAHAAIAMESANQLDEVTHLRIALTRNRRIGAAMGILMCRRNLTETQAFDALRHRSQHTDRKLYDVADDVLLTGDL